MKLCVILLAVLFLVHQGQAGIWSVLFSPKVLTAIAASIGVDVVKEKWISASPDQMFDQIQQRLQTQMQFQLADALMKMKQEDKLPNPTDHTNTMYVIYAVGLVMVGIMGIQYRQQKKWKKLALQKIERGNSA